MRSAYRTPPTKRLPPLPALHTSAARKTKAEETCCTDETSVSSADLKKGGVHTSDPDINTDVPNA